MQELCHRRDAHWEASLNVFPFFPAPLMLTDGGRGLPPSPSTPVKKRRRGSDLLPPPTPSLPKIQP
eukprot:9838524-Karenia_brevis.AAC.1